MSAFDDLMVHLRQTEALGQVAGRLGWDQETMMPQGAAPQRAEEMAAMEEILHARRTDPVLGDWLASAQAPDMAGEAVLRLVRESYTRNRKVSAKLAAEIARVTSLSQGEWAQARADENVAAFLPRFKEVVALRREEAAALADGGDLYDALLNDYEPGAKGADLAVMFDAMRPRLVALRAAVLDAEPAPQVHGAFDRAGQLALSREVAAAFGYDFTKGRIDIAVHPFSSGSGCDVRITTRVAEDDPFNCIYSTIHEVGHACYEQNVSEDYLLTPISRGASMGVHESQSRIYENQMGRSEAFTGWLYGRMRDHFGDFGIDSPRDFYRAVNRATSGYIRTEADEVHYNLHVMLRFDLERALIAGDLAVNDLETAWNDRFTADFGITVDKPSNGVLQDVHWPVGLMGYFPTYSLGNVFAGCLDASLRAHVPDIDAALARGEATVATKWLTENLQINGSLRTPVETITHATGEAPQPEPLLSYLEAKFGDLYGF